jgi:phage terminase large subunit-like protein
MGTLADDLLRALTSVDVVAFIDAHVQKNELGQPFRLLDHQQDILRLAFFDAEGRLPYDTIIYACPKKSGKTTINAAITLWWGLTQDAPNEVLVIANDLEQAQGRVFAAMAGVLAHNPGLDPGARVLTREIRLGNGTVITATAAEYAGAAGSNHGWTSWDELWGYTSESARRLWEELTPVPTRKNSIRFITTYAGWEGESRLLWELYTQGVGPAEHPAGQAARRHPELPLYANREARLCVYWDHAPRMPWQTPEYYASQRRTLRPGTYLRLHENRWATSEEAFITPALWDPCVDRGLSPALRARDRRLFVGVDAATKHDTAAVVAVCWDGDRLALAAHRIWQPTPADPLDLEATVEAYLRTLHAHFHVAQVFCDPYQLHRTIMTLKGAGVSIEEFPQTSANCTRMGQALFDLLNGRKLRLYPAADLRQQALQTVSLETPRGWRIAKEKAGHKIDAIVALAMACVAAVEAGNTVAASVSPAEMEAIWAQAAAERAAAGEPEPDGWGARRAWRPRWGRSLRRPGRFWR